MKSDQKPQDEEKGGISEDLQDALVKAVRTDLESVNKRTDNKLLVALGVLVSLVFLYDRSEFKSVWLDYLLIAGILGAIVYTIYSVIRQKKMVAVKYGLVCPVCGHTPKANMVLLAAELQLCRKCGGRLNVNIAPSSGRKRRR
jgi:formate dehydrogenase maturation protein FdhE